jgi:hypothetical protein
MKSIKEKCFEFLDKNFDIDIECDFVSKENKYLELSWDYIFNELAYFYLEEMGDFGEGQIGQFLDSWTESKLEE